MVCLGRPDRDGRRRLRHLLRPRRRAAQGLGQVVGTRRGGRLPAPARGRRRGRRGGSLRCQRPHQTGGVRGRARAPAGARRRAPGVRARAARRLQVPAGGHVRGRAPAHASRQGRSRPAAPRPLNPSPGGSMPYRSRFAVALVLALLPAVAVADEAARPTKLTADFGYVKTSGNSDVTTVTGSDKLEQTSGAWAFTQEASAVWGETDGVE